MLLSASRSRHAVLDALAIQTQRFALLAVERALQAAFLGVAPPGIRSRTDSTTLVSSPFQLRLGALDLAAHLDHFGVTIAVALRQRRLLALQIRDVGLQLLDVFVGDDGRIGLERAGPFSGSQLVVERFLVDPLGLGLRERGVQVGQPLHHDVRGAVGHRHRAVLLLERLERRLAHLEGLALLGQAIAEEVGGVLRRVEPELHVLLDVRLGHGVGGRGGELRIGRGVADFDDAAVLDRHNRQPAEKLIDAPRLLLGFVGRLGAGGGRRRGRRVGD